MAWQVGHPIQRDGVNQWQRLLRALDPAYAPIDGRDEADIVYQLYQIAGLFAYFNTRNERDGTWQAFFTPMADEKGLVSRESIQAYLEQARKRHNNSVFLTILLSFLRLYRHVQDDANALTRQHLDFYYRQVLDFRRLGPAPDEAHVVFELAPHLQQHLLPAGTALKAGKDALGKPLTYRTTQEIVLNQARIASIRTVVADENGVWAAEVANSADGRGAPLDGAAPHWPTFGDPAYMQRSAAGFAIASPLLLLKEGDRTIELTLAFATEVAAADLGAFRQLKAAGSGAEGWVDLSGGEPVWTATEPRRITFTFTADTAMPAITGYQSQVLDGQINTAFPVLRLLLPAGSPAWNTLRKYSLANVEMTVKVGMEPGATGVRDLILQNDLGRLHTGSLFQPFGPAPVKGSQFYIGSAEVFGKPLEQLTINWEWAGLPENGLPAYYNVGSYKENTDANAVQVWQAPYINNDAFTVSTDVLKNREWVQGSAKESLFPPSGKMAFAQNELGTLLLLSSPPEPLDLNAQQGFIRFKLGQDFGHLIYPKLLTELSVKPLGAGGEKTFPNPPYTPAVKAISLAYTASQQVALNTPGAGFQFFRLGPFGSEEISGQAAAALLPDFPRGALYLGIAGLEPPQNLHLLFQIAEGSAVSTDILKAGDIRWTYLTARGWRKTPLEGSEIFTDTTQALQQPGILAVSIGADAVSTHSLMPRGLHWLRAAIDKDPACAARAIAIRTQAVSAVFEDNQNDPQHPALPLPAGSIQGLLKHDSAVRKVEQPYASFGGRAAESDRGIYTRVSERLRHRQRAITLWDIERLVLQHFPQLFEVKVIPHTGWDADGFYSEFLPGHITVVVIPQLCNRNAVNLLQPRVSDALREQIRDYLAPLMMPAMNRAGIPGLHVVNPRYEPVQIACSVGFRPGYDPGFYTEVLHKALQRRLSPWAFEEGEDIRFGATVYKSQMLAFVEEQEYVDYVTDFRMWQADTGPGVEEMEMETDLFVRGDAFGLETDVARTSTAASILVSADRHLIKALKPGEYQCEEPNACEGGVECWYVDIDFIVS